MGTKAPRATKTTSGLKSPYRFVTPATHVFFPDWADDVSHDRPFADGLCGHFDLNIEALTPLFTRDDEVHEDFLNLDGAPFIKGTSLRGMLRNVVAIASMGKLAQVDDRRFGVRDITRSDTYYAKTLRAAKSGWLQQCSDEHGQVWYVLYPCDMAVVYHTTLKSFQDGWEPDLPFELKCNTWNEKVLNVAGYRDKFNNKIVDRLGHGSKKGHLVFTGHVPNKKGVHYGLGGSSGQRRCAA